MRRQHRILTFLLTVALLQTQGGRHATAARGDADVARTERARGTVAVNLGNYAAAIEHFSRAYSLTQDPTLLFSLAQAYRLAMNPEKALSTYSAFLRSAGNAPRYRSQVERATWEIESITSYMVNRPASTPAVETPVPPDALDDKLAPLVKAAIEPPPALSAKTDDKTTTSAELPAKESLPAFSAKPDAPPAPALVFLNAGEPEASRHEPIYKSWVLWTSTAVLLAAGGAAAWYYYRPGHEAPGSTYGSIKVLP